MPEPVGRVVATEARPSTPHQFVFAAAPDAPVGIGAIVRVDAPERTVFAMVTDATSHQAGDRPFHAYTASVLRQEPADPLQPVPLGPVHLATDADVRMALRMDGYADGDAGTAIPLGVYGTGGHAAPVYLDADFLLGPEAAHLNITGVSGLATKTSAIEFLLTSIFQAFPASKGSVAAVCFNVKGPDLCFLDQPADLAPEDLALYARLGLDPRPFEQAEYFAPLKADGVNLNTLRSHPALAANTAPLTWGLREVLEFAEVALNRDDLDAKADAFVDFLADRVVGKEFHAPELKPQEWRVTSFADLEQFFRAIFDALEESHRGELWRTHHIATIRKVRNRLGNITTRAKGLVTDDGAASDLPWGAFADRGMYVVDVAGMDPLAQDLAFARIVSKLREHLERRDLGVDHVVVFVDELNKYAPADGADTYVRRMLLDLSERGRYLGLVLFSAQQFRSQVLRRVVGNAGTALHGRMDSDELATAGYGTLTHATRSRLATLAKGELMVRHPHFTHPVFLRFPRPCVLSGREGVEQFPPAPELPFDLAVTRQMKLLDRGVSAERVLALLEGRREDEVRRALARTRQARPDDVLAFFAAALGRRVEPEPAVRRAVVTPLRDAPDPYMN